MYNMTSEIYKMTSEMYKMTSEMYKITLSYYVIFIKDLNMLMEDEVLSSALNSLFSRKRNIIISQ
jgi:hypothetical protein